MATLVTEQGIVHYEAYGRGRPVLLLHGWLNSWAVWRKTVEVLGTEFRVYAVDFLGFGDSGDQAEEFSVNNFTLLVDRFMDRLAIPKAAIVGHSMGGTVALSAAMRYPEKIAKVIVIGSPIHGSSLSPLLKLAANRSWIGLGQSTPVLYNLFQSGFKPFLRVYSRLLSSDGETLGKMLSEDAGKLAIAPFIESITTLRQTDLRPRLNELKMPILGIYGKRDLIVSPHQYQPLREYVKQSQIAWFAQSGHFPMLDESERFHETVSTFLKTDMIPANSSAPPR